MSATIMYFDDMDIWIIDLDGYNSGKRMIEIKDEKQAWEMFNFIEKQQHEIDSTRGLWCTDKDPKEFFKEAWLGLCVYASNPENYECYSSELSDFTCAIDAIVNWQKISFQL